MDDTPQSGHGACQYTNEGFSMSTISNENHKTEGEIVEESKGSVVIIYMNVALSITETLLFGGIQFGWSSLVFVYKDIGLYEDLCAVNRTSDQSEVCPDQEEYLNLFFSIATTLLFFTSVAVGFIHHRLGTTRCRLVFIGIYPCGLLLLSFTSSDVPWLFLPGLTLVGLSGLAVIVTDMHVVSHIKKGKAFFITVLNGAFDSSAVMMVIVKMLYERGIKIQFIFWGILAAQLVVTLANTFLHWKQSQLNLKSTEETEDEKGNKSGNQIQPNAKDPTLRQSVCSIRFAFYLIWAFVLTMRWSTYLGFANRQFTVVLETDEMVSEYTNILSYSLFSGVLVAIISGSFLECIKKPFKGESDVGVYPLIIALFLCCTMSLVISLLGIVQSAETFYAEFVVIPFYRSLFFSTNMNFVVTMYHKNLISRIMVISFVVMGVGPIAQYFVFKWVVENDTFQQMNYMMLGLTLISFALPCVLLLNERNESNKGRSEKSS